MDASASVVIFLATTTQRSTMHARTIDHVNLRVPADGLDAAREFYEEGLGFPLEGVDRFESGDKPFFDVRLAPENVLHLWPSEGFAEPAGDSYDHVALVVEEDVGTIKEQLARAGIDVERELDSPSGATGEAGAVYVRDPFGYRVELKEPVRRASGPSGAHTAGAHTTEEE